MHLFISWSGGRSHRLAATMKQWLEAHFPDEITAFVSSEIEKAAIRSRRPGHRGGAQAA